MSSNPSSPPKSGARERASGSPPSTASLSRTAATSGCTVRWAEAPPSRSICPGPTNRWTGLLRANRPSDSESRAGTRPSWWWRTSRKALAESFAVKQGVQPRVLFMSGYIQDDIVSEGRLAASVDFLEKPFTSEGLLGKVREVLDRPAEG